MAEIGSGLSDLSKKTKGFWDRTEGTVGIGVLALIGCGIAYGISLILPWLITLLENTLYASLLLGAVILIFMLVSQKRFWTLLSYFFKSAMRAMTGIFIELDPIGILKGYLDTLRDNLTKMDEQISKVVQQGVALKEAIRKALHEYDEAMSLAATADKIGNKSSVQLHTRVAGRLKESATIYEDLLKKNQTIHTVLLKMQDASNFMYEDIKSEIKISSEKKKMIDASSGAMRSAMKIIKGTGDDKQLYDETLDFLVEDYASKLGEIEHGINSTKGFLDGVDLQNINFEDKAMAELKKWEEGTIAPRLLGDQRMKEVKQAHDLNNSVQNIKTKSLLDV